MVALWQTKMGRTLLRVTMPDKSKCAGAWNWVRTG